MLAWNLKLRHVIQLGTTFVYILLLLIHLLLSPCHATIVRLPLKRATGLERGMGVDGIVGRVHRTVDSVIQHMEGISGEGYYIDISVGTPSQEMQVLVDTGSSNFALAASPNPHITHYFNSSLSSSYKEGMTNIFVPYTEGEWEGLLGTDIVTLTSLPNVSLHPNIAFIHHSTGFFIPESNWQGIVGMAYQSIARPDSLVPFWDTVRDEANLEDVFSMQLCGSSYSHNQSGEAAMEGNLILGGVSEDLFRGLIFHSPIAKEMYYEVVITDIAVDGSSLAMDCKEYNYDKTIVDSGTTHLRLPSRVFNRVVERIRFTLQKTSLLDVPSPAFWTGDDLLCWENLSLAFDVFPIVSLSLISAEGHNKFFILHLSSQHYLRSVKMEDAGFGFRPSQQTCLKFGISPSDSGSVLGALLMESFYVVFDRQNKRMGFAETTCPPPYPNGKRYQSIEGIFRKKENLTACQYQRAMQDDSTLLVVTYVMAAICFVCALPLIIVIVQWQIRKLTSKRRSPRDAEAETVLTDRDSR